MLMKSCLRYVYLVTLLLILHINSAWALSNSPDSLLQVLKTARDSSKVKTLLALAEYYNNKDNNISLDYSKKALVAAKAGSYKKFIAKANLDIGNNYNSIGQYEAATPYLIESYKVAIANNDLRAASRAANALANMYLGAENLNKAEEYYSLVEDLGNKLDDDYIRSLAWLGLGNVVQKQNKLDLAIEYSDKATEGFMRSGKLYPELISRMNKGSILHQLKRYKEAYATFKEAMPTVNKLNDNYVKSLVEAQLGNTCVELGLFEEAISCLRSAKKLNGELTALDNLKDIYLYHSNYFERVGDKDSAIFYLKAYIHLKDSIFRAESSKQINEAEAKFKSAEKDAKIQQHLANAKLRDAEDARKTMFRNVLVIGLCVAVLSLVFVFRSNIQKKKAYIEVSNQKRIIEYKNKEIVDSIEYAKRIQKTLLASDSLLKKHLKDHFILYKPKDIVSGDFYWATEVNGRNGSADFMICTADCTGHGVPGAFMSLLCISFLNEITRDRNYIEPNKIFTRLKREIVASLNPDEAIHTRDGMDAVLCHFDFEKLVLTSACANNPVLIIRNEELIEIKPDKNPIGKSELTGYDYTLHKIDLQKGDLVYTFTDGYADQFGGEAGKKFKYKRLRELLFQNRFLSMAEQRQKLNQTIESWKGSLEQLDDVLVIGIRV